LTQNEALERSSGVLSREAMKRLIESERPLVAGYLDLDAQLQPNGIDLTLAAVGRHRGGASIGVSNNDRVLPEIDELMFDEYGWMTLEPGIYHITYNETVSLPNDLMAFGRPRSSIARSGAAIHTAVWDAGYSGRSTSLLHVINPEGLRVQKNARVTQLVFITLVSATDKGYAGIYQDENRG